jgi:AcrR family transcriptional regulator
MVVSEGASAVSLRAVARRIGVSHAAPANHFRDKAGLFTALAVEGFQLMGTAMADAAGEVQGLDPATAQLAGAGIGYLHFAIGHPAHFEVMWRNDLLHAGDPDLVAASAVTWNRLLDGVKGRQALGWAPGADPVTVAELLWASVHGLATLWLGGTLPANDPRPFDEVAGSVLDLLGSALTNPATTQEGAR